MLRGLLVVALLGALLLAGCGGDGDDADPVSQVPAEGGVQDRVREAQSPSESDFPAAQGKTLDELAAEVKGGGSVEAGLATSVFTVGEDRLAFGVIDQEGQFVYGKTAVYVAPSPGAAAQGPYPAPADVLMTEGRYRSQQAATEGDPFAAVYSAQVEFTKPGQWAVMTVTQTPEGLVAAPAQVTVSTKKADRIPDVGEAPPLVDTDTVESAKGNVESIDTRRPTSDMHAASFKNVVGKKPVVLLFATPQLCQSRVCGPVVDVALQLKSKYGDQVEFIHQEVYVGNDVNKGLREPLKAFRLPTEPWLFVVGADGRITARLEGSFGLDAFEDAINTAL